MHIVYGTFPGNPHIMGIIICQPLDLWNIIPSIYQNIYVYIYTLMYIYPAVVNPLIHRSALQGAAAKSAAV